MLGVGSSITSGVPESKYSASFDGTDDKINCGASNNVVANGASEVSVMFWIKTTDTTQKYVFSIKKGAGSSAFSARINFQSANKIEGVIHTGSGSHTYPKGTTSINDGNWHHVAITGKALSQKIYIDGTLEDTHTDGFDMNTSADPFEIGDHNGGYFIDMSLFELAVFNTELDLANIQAAYNSGKEFNLAFDQGNYNSSSNLVAYYKMGNGFFDDKANGIVHDQDNPGFGTELLLVPDFSNSGDLDNTTLSSLGYNLQPGGVTTASVQNGELTISVTTPDTNAGRVFMNCADGVTLTANNTYKVTYTVVSNSDFDGSDHFSIWNGGGYADVPHTVGTHVEYFAWSGSDRTNLPIQLAGNTSTATITLSNLSLVKLNGNPGLTSGGVTFSSDTP